MRITAVSALKDEISVHAMQDSDIGIAVNGDMVGEVFFRNIAGVHGLTIGRYWPSDFALNHGSTAKRSEYTPDFNVRLLVVGDTLTRTE
jgi:hypothetical protein